MTIDLIAHRAPSRLEPRRLSAAVLLVFATLADSAQAQSADAGTDAGISDVIVVTADPNRILPNAPSESSFGFNKPLLETPRSVSFISQETIELFGLSAVEDLVQSRARRVHDDALRHSGRHRRAQRRRRYVFPRHEAAEPPGPRPQRARGDGHDRSRQGAAVADLRHGQDRRLHEHGAEGRARGRRRLSRSSRRASRADHRHRTIARESSFGIGGPLSFDAASRAAITSTAWPRNPNVRRAGRRRPAALQAAISVDDLLGDFRLETGVNYQKSTTSGALTGRFDAGTRRLGPRTSAARRS